MPPTINVRHIGAHRVSVAERLAHLRGLLRRGAFSFDEAVRGADRMTVAVTLFALLELYKRGEAELEQQESFGDIAVRALARRLRHRRGARPAGRPGGDPADVIDAIRRTPGMSQRRGASRRAPAAAGVPRSRARSRRCCSCQPDPLSDQRTSPRPRRPREAAVQERARAPRPSSTRPAAAGSSCASWAAAGRSRATPAPRTPPAGCSAAPAPPRSRPPRPRRSRSSPTCSRYRARRSRESAGSAPTPATATLLERGLIEEAGHSQFGAVLYRTSNRFLKLFGLRTLRGAAGRSPAGTQPRRSRPGCASGCCGPARPARAPGDVRGRPSPLGRRAASWPQAASMSRPRVRRTVTGMPRASSGVAEGARSIRGSIPR